MKFMLTTHPGYGHFFPMVPLARAIRDNGHDVVFAISRVFSTSVKRAGFEFLPVGLDWNDSQLDETLPEICSIPRRERALWIAREIFLDRSPKRMIPDLLAAVGAWKPDVIVSSTYEHSGIIVAEKKGIPYASFNVSPMVPKQFIQYFMNENIDRLRARFGCPPDPELKARGQWLELSFMPPSWGFPGYEKGPTEHFIQPVGFDGSFYEKTPGWIEELPDQPTVYVSLGTVFTGYRRVFETIIAAFHNELLNLILSLGGSMDPSTFGPQPDNIRIERFVPESLLLPHVDACINHGGNSTVMKALSAGLPFVLLPLSADQPLVASVCYSHGVAVPISDEAMQIDNTSLYAIDPEALQPRMIHTAVQSILTEEKYRATAQNLQTTIKSLPSVDRAVELLEQLAMEKIPVTA